MKSKLVALSCVIMLSTALSACVGSDNSSISTTSVGTTVTTTTTLETIEEPIQYNGTFNEDVFNQICQNIKIDDMLISFPCIAKEFDSNISLGEKPIILEKEKIVNYELLYNETIIGSCSFRYTENAEDLNNIIMTGLALNKKGNTDVANVIDAGGITFQYSKQQIIALLGEPTNREEYSSGSEELKYFADNDRYLCFMFDMDDSIKSIEFYDEKE